MSAEICPPRYWKLLWVLYCKEWFRLKRNPAALMATGLIVLMAFLVSLENHASKIARQQSQLPCAVVFNMDSDLIAALKARQWDKQVRFIKVDANQLRHGLNYDVSMRCLAEILESDVAHGKHAISITYRAMDANNSQMAQFNRWILTELASLNPTVSLTQRLRPLKEQGPAPTTLGKIDLASDAAKAMIGAMMIFSAQYFLCMALVISFTGHERERGILQALALTNAAPGQMLFAKLLFHISLSFVVSIVIFKVITGAAWKLLAIIGLPVLLPMFLSSSLGFFALATIIVSLNSNQTSASLVGFSYLMVMGVIFSLATKFKAFALLKAWMFESHAIELFQHWLGGKRLPGAVIVAHMFDLLILSVVLWCVAYWLFKRQGWRA